MGLILNSFINNEFAAGLLVLIIHDVSDIFLDIMKMANYLKLEGIYIYIIYLMLIRIIRVIFSDQVYFYMFIYIW